MGARTWMLVYSEASARGALSEVPSLDRDASKKFARELFPEESLVDLGDTSLEWTCPPDDEVLVGCFAGVAIVAAKEFAIERPSQINQRFVDAGRGANITLHAMHSVVDWFAFAHWIGGGLVRSLSLSPDTGVLEDIGEKLSFELPYWAGENPAVDEDAEDSRYPLPFHPLDLGEAALMALFGYQLEGDSDEVLFDPETIALMRFKRKKPIFRV